MTAESTLVGHVCQLNYGWGGLLEYSTVAGSQHVPFSASTLPLRIGQEVAFYLQCEGNRIEAVNLQAPCSPPSSRSNDANNPETKNRFQTAEASISDVLSPTSASPILQRQIQRLQQRIAVFGNASQEEQCQMVLEAERALDSLLDETDLDGDALCRLVRRCASWLHAPSLSAATKKPLDEETTAASQEIPGHFNLQQRVRKLLIRALSHLDLRDEPTFQAMEAALLYVALFIQSLEEREAFSRTSLPPAIRQWFHLYQLLPKPLQPRADVAVTVLEVESHQLRSKSQGRNQRTGDAGGYKKAFAGKVYQPSTKTLKLSTVSQDLSCPPVELKCNWYFQHPKTFAWSVLAPRDGHNQCQQSLKKRCSWQSLDGSHVMAGISSNLQFCQEHQRLLTQCAPCGGKKMCSHGRQKYHCKDCRGNGFCAHGRRKFNCSRCKAKLAEAVKSVKGCCRECCLKFVKSS